jgi:Protein of unknown function (DUF2934)
MVDAELETKTRRRAHEIWASEGRPDGAADRHWLAAERELVEEVHSAAVCRWTAPVEGTYAAEHAKAAAEREAAQQAQNAAVSRWTGAAKGSYVGASMEAAGTTAKA